MRNASIRDYTRDNISRKIWNATFQIFQEILERIFLLSRIKFLGNFVLMKFSTNLEQDLWGCIPKFSENFGVPNFLKILGYEIYGN